MAKDIEDCACPLCASTENRKVLSGKDYLVNHQELFTVVQCSLCAHFFTSPRPTAESIEKYYPNTYMPYKEKMWLWKWLEQSLNSWRARKLAQSLPEAARLLEVGCGRGDFLHELKQCGLQVKGVELSKEAADNARDRLGLDVQRGSIESYPLGTEEYDAIVLRHVIEHIFSPVDACRRFANALKPGGKLFLTCPSIESLGSLFFSKYWQGLELPRHLQHFTPKTLRMLMEKVDLRVIDLSHSMVPNSMIYSAGRFVEQKTGVSAPRFFSPNNPFLLCLFTPIAILAALLGRAERISVIAQKRSDTKHD